MSTVRKNLLEDKYYTPYCGYCDKMPRTVKFGDQFKCPNCAWVSQFPADFIKEYKNKWGE